MNACPTFGSLQPLIWRRLSQARKFHARKSSKRTFAGLKLSIRASTPLLECSATRHGAMQPRPTVKSRAALRWGRCTASPSRSRKTLTWRPRAAPWIGMARPRWPERTGEARSPGQLTRFALAFNGMRFSVHTGRPVAMAVQAAIGARMIPWPRQPALPPTTRGGANERASHYREGHAARHRRGPSFQQAGRAAKDLLRISGEVWTAALDAENASYNPHRALTIATERLSGFERRRIT